MLIGAHVSAAGGVWNAPKNATALGCEAFQIFSRPPQGGPATPITPELKKTFQAALQEHKLEWFCIHTPYYINFASATTRIVKTSISVVRDELERGSALGAKYVMAHLGSFKDLGKEKGLAVLAAGLDEVLDGYKGSTQFLIEISAGAGAIIGDTFEEIAAITKHPRLKNYDIGVCFDTQHAFASGYDLRTTEGVDATWKKAEKLLGKNKIKMSHCNDSKVEFNSHRDRHEHIGKGYLGTDAFKHLFSHPGFGKLTFILETEHDSVMEDITLLKKIRKNLQ